MTTLVPGRPKGGLKPVITLGTKKLRKVLLVPTGAVLAMTVMRPVVTSGGEVAVIWLVEVMVAATAFLPLKKMPLVPEIELRRMPVMVTTVSPEPDGEV